MREVDEYDFFELEPNDIKRLVFEVYDGGRPVIIRNGGLVDNPRVFWMSQFKRFMTHDRRQFSHDSQYFTSDWWEITNDSSRDTSYAFATTPQPFHTDNAWFMDPPEINLFIMLKQAQKGGEQLLITVDDIIDCLKIENPNLLDELTSRKVRIKKGSEEDIFNETTIIQYGEVSKIFWNYYRCLKNADNQKMIEDFFQFLESKRESEIVYKIHLNTGDCLINNDIRAVHGRNRFWVSKERDRSLIQSMWKMPADAR